MPHIRFARFVILDSIPAGQAPTGRQLHEALSALAREHKLPVSVDHISVPTRAKLEAVLDEIRVDAINTDRIPLLHFECHGNDDGIKLAGGDFIHWYKLCEYLTTLNIISRLNLFVSIAACLGSYLSSQFNPTQRAPVSACLSTTKTAFPDQLYRGFYTFYSTLFNTMNANEGLKKLKLFNTAEDQSFYLSEATDFFKLVYRAYLKNHCTPEKYRQRAEDIREEQKERGLPVTSVEVIYQRLVATAPESFEKFRQQYFMIDLFPENVDRFPVTAADVDPGRA
jgi:hypothetical protein